MKMREITPPEVGFQTAPMIDVVFLLLIFFIVTYKLNNHETELDVKVPTAIQGAPKSQQSLEELINIKRDGAIVMEKKFYTLEQLEKKMKRLTRVNKDQSIRLRADKDTPWQKVITVVDKCKKAGISNISFATKKPTSSK